jgi:ABC-type branched-subunit amino acid transport system ATPase component
MVLAEQNHHFALRHGDRGYLIEKARSSTSLLPPA